MDSSTPTTPISSRPSKPLLRAPPPELEVPSTQPSPTSPLPAPPSSSKSTHSQTSASLPDLLLLSPPPYRKPPAPLARPHPLIVESIDCMAAAAVLTPGSRRKGKSRAAAGASPRNGRRTRRRLEKEISREEKEKEIVPFDEEGAKLRCRRRSKARGHRAEKLALVWAPVDPPSSPSSRTCEIGDDEGMCGSGDGVWEVITELVMWRNAAKSSLWLGLGTVIFVSSCFWTDVGFSIISALSHLGLLALGFAFSCDSLPQRQRQPRGARFKLTEEDILRVARFILPVANVALAKSQEVFSGEPLMTLKVAPMLVFTAKYGHLITPWRLSAIGFFLSFTLPKFYSCYSNSVHTKAADIRSCVLEAWESCSQKKFLAVSTAVLLWNLLSIKMRFLAAFIFAVVLRYHRQQHIGGEIAEDESREGELQEAITVANRSHDEATQVYCSSPSLLRNFLT